MIDEEIIEVVRAHVEGKAIQMRLKGDGLPGPWSDIERGEPAWNFAHADYRVKPAQSKTAYFTFGQEHVHQVGGYVYDKNVLVKITAPDPRGVMFETFGSRWAFEYDEPPEPQYWPRGMIEL